MEININTYKPFVSAMNDMKEKYGEKFEYYNGFHKSQLSLTEFIDNFIISIIFSIYLLGNHR